ncbi:MAG: MBL fold metallo-hydrolase [Phycisphaeraceae bacterium]|nr:MBL fold metallo-hydrolase [Phycisphaerales bacterium]MCB9859656.1 MBL fold metallo-hydrolase [Phycisphaeraceae bacterium]
MDVRVISIGALASHPLRKEPAGDRTGHATITLVRTKGRAILVDPGLPAPAVAALLPERAGIEADQITHVFLTRFSPDTARGIRLFDHATWWIHNDEREQIGLHLATKLRELIDASGPGSADEDDESGIMHALQQDIAVLQRFEPAPDRLIEDQDSRADLFPLPGVSPGLAGLLIPQSRRTLLITGDAIATTEHLAKGAVISPCHDLEQAKESFAEAVEIADVIIPGRDNVLFNDARQMF